MSQVIQALQQQIYLSNLFGYDYTIHYKLAASNVVVDTLSCITPDCWLLIGSHTTTLHTVALHSTCRWSEPSIGLNAP